MSFTQNKESREAEEALVKEFQAGNLEAYDKIAQIYQKKIYALSFNLTRNQMDALGGKGVQCIEGCVLNRGFF